MNDKFGEVKARKNFFPSDAEELVKKGKVGILLLQNSPSDKTLKILREGKIAVYTDLEPKEVERALKETSEKLKERDQKEHE